MKFIWNVFAIESTCLQRSSEKKRDFGDILYTADMCAEMNISKCLWG